MKLTRNPRFFLRLILSCMLIVLTSIGLFIRYSPERTFNIPLGQRFAQIHVNKGFNIFFPTDDTTFLYLHNFNYPQYITSGSTRLESLKSNKTEENNIKPIPPGRHETPTPKPASPKYIKSKILNLTFTTPEGVDASYGSPPGTPHELIDYRIGYNMRIWIWGKDQIYNCKDTSINDYFSREPKTILFANKIPLVFTYGGDPTRGWVEAKTKKYLPSKEACIEITQEVTSKGDEEKIFDQILTSAKLD